ncbi:MAG: hypothetical protein U0Q55_21370 [Vicinamibacterales bacterium]
MSNELSFEGDPETDSTRRQMERLLNQPSRGTVKKAAVAGATAWGLWRLFRLLAPSSWKKNPHTPTRR